MSVLDTKRKRDVRRQRGQFIAVGVTIGLGVMLFASTYSAYLNLDDSYNFTYDRLDFADMTVIGADPIFADEAAAIDGVDVVDTRFEADIPMRVGDDVFLGRIVSLPADDQPLINKVDISEGTYLDPADESGVLIESHMADQFELGPGDSVEVLVGPTWVEGEVVGVAVSPEYIWPARDRQDIFPLPGTFGVVYVADSLFADVPDNLIRPDVLVTYADGVEVAEMDSVLGEAARADGAGAVIPRSEHPSHSTLQLDVQGFEQLAIMFPALFMSAAGLAAFVLLTRLVIAQRSQIGTMRASGMAKRRILRHYLSYGTRIGLSAAVVGLAIGLPAGFAITSVYTSELGIPDTVTEFHWVTLIVGILFGLAAGALGAWAPARTAFKLSPAEAMRGDVPSADGNHSLFEKVLPPLKRLPVRWLMVLRGLGRNKRRSFSTVIGVVLAMTLVMVSWGMIDTMRWVIDTQFNVVATEDANVILAAPATDDLVGEVAAVEGVDFIEVVPHLETTMRANGESYTTTIHAYDGGSELHSFPHGLPPNGILAGEALAGEIGVGVGDTVTVGLPTLDVTFETTIEGFLEEPVGTYAYIDRALLESQLEDPAVLDQSATAVLKTAFFDDVTDREAVLDGLKEVESVAAAVDARLLYNLIQDFAGFFYVFVGVMLVFGGAMAFSLMFNTISVNVAERSGEFATMRANGLSHASIARLIAVENLLLTFLGVIPGAIVGYLIGAYFMGAYSSDTFSLDFRMDGLSIVLTGVAMLGVATLSLIPAIRTIRRLDIGEVVRERAA